MKTIRMNLLIFYIGALGYSLIEIMWRGKTHWTMGLTGGLCLLILYHIFLRYEHIPVLRKCLIGTGLITAIEFIVGCIVNLILRWDVWSYYGSPFNLLGQICLLYSILWFFLSFVAVYLTYFLRNNISRLI